MSFSSIVGQNELKQRLGQALTGNPGHAYIFIGPKGVGRTWIARTFAAALLCRQPGSDGACGVCSSCRYFQQQVHPDYRELQLQGKEKVIPVESVRRQIGADLYMQPQLGQRKVYLIAADDLNEQGQNALLKSLEEPPPYAIFLLTASGADHLLPTIVSRAVLHIVSRRSPDEIMAILHDKGLDKNDAVNFFVRFSKGLPGTAIELAGNDWFSDLRKDTIRFFTGIPRMSRSDLLTTGFQFCDANRQHLGDILNVMGSLIRDLLVLAGNGGREHLINDDHAAELNSFLSEYTGPEKVRRNLGLAWSAILAARRGLALNASFEGLACNLMLALRKELSYA
ncbi:MAG: hypothetical protein SCM11_00115 [Bacillota bacterium]|nr:hypothetical protein [Bacillota bacterium]